MKFAYKFSNLCGTVYSQGNVTFTANDCVVSPVGNRVTIFDLKNNKSTTLHCENRKNISRIALSPNGCTLITIDEDGRALLISLAHGTVLHHFNFKDRVRDIVYSPCGKYFAVTHGYKMQIWHAPGTTVDFAPFRLMHVYAAQFDDSTCIDWSSDSRFIVVGSKDMTCRVYTVNHVPGFTGVTMSGHRNTVRGIFFQENSLNIYSLGKDCSLFVWRCSHSLGDALAEFEQIRRAVSSDEGSGSSDEERRIEPPRKRAKKVPGKNLVPVRWTLSEEDKHLFIQEKARIMCSAFHKQRNLLVIGFSNGVFSLYDMPEFNEIHSLSISQQKISSVAINPTGDWLAFGCRSRGQLLVWEWASESYLMKQQGHFYDMSCLEYSPDGQYLATGGDDSKVKIWNTLTGFCFVTFSEHTGGVTAIKFGPSGKVVISASRDGTVRAFDLHRYRNFRTFASPRPAQFCCLALDTSGELVCAGSQDTFEIFVWSMQTGRLLELLSGHDGPVSGVAFQPSTGQLVSCSWDKTVKVWDVLNRSSAQETIQVNSDAVALAFRPDGQQFAVSTLDGTISFFDMNCKQLGSIEGRRDLGAGRRATDLVTAKQTAGGKAFTGLCYTADGSCLLAGGRSKFVCIYNVAQQVLIKKFVISRNRSFDGMTAFLNGANMTEAGPLDLIDRDSDSESERRGKVLPGVTAGDMSSRRTKPEIRTKAVQFSPTGRAWAAASTEGLLIYSLDASVVFDPIELDVDVTPSRIVDLLEKGEMLGAVVMSLRLNEIELIQRVLETVPVDEVEMLCGQLPVKYAELLVRCLGGLFEKSRHLQFYLSWSGALLRAHARSFKQHSNALMPSLQSLHKAVSQKYEDVEKLCDENMYTMQYLGQVSKLKYTAKEDRGDDDEGEDQDEAEDAAQE